ncbi:MAG: MarR family transcriptional regulator, partial [Bacteroidia bacterium]|nr:MarR family transcriptional regulator [Bacteroidia bacterium]
LEEKNLVKSSSHKVDGRKRLIDLTPKAFKTIEKMKPIWAKMIKGLEEITDTKNNLMKAMNEVEEKIRQESFYERTNRMLKKK